MSEEVVDDRRAALEAAYEAATSDEKEAVVEVKTEPPRDEPEPVTESKAETAEPMQTTPAEVVEKPEEPVEKAPQSWRAGAKAKWATVDPEIQQEVSRRELETTRVLSDSAQARQLATQFNQTVQPYMARLQAMNAHPLQAVGELLKADYLLSTGQVNQKANLIAKLIQDYEVDISALDRALAGGPQKDEPRQAQQLTPQDIQREVRAAIDAQTLAQSVEQMQKDTAKFPHFDEVRETMADLIELTAKKGQQLSLEAAYNKAVAMDPDLSKVRVAQEAQQQVAQLNQRAQRAKAASSSVGGAPTGGTGAPGANLTRRQALEAAYEQSNER